MSDDEVDKLKHDILYNNKMLYHMCNKPCTETCMCWGLEISKGWLEAVDKMSKSLEGLNFMFYPRFRVRVQADQVKEKFGTLHFYYTIVSDPPKWMSVWHNLFNRFFNYIECNVDFRFIEVVDSVAHDEVVEKELATREEFEAEKKANKYCANVEVFERYGKFIKKSTYHHYEKTHAEPTKNRLLYKLLSKKYAIENWPTTFFNYSPTHKQLCISNVLEDKVKKIVKNAEDECFNVCECCGHHISDDNNSFSPRCTTRGWITYLCKECADKSNLEYVMNGSVWKNNKEIIDKKQYAEELARIDAKFNATDDNAKEDENEN